MSELSKWYKYYDFSSINVVCVHGFTQQYCVLFEANIQKTNKFSDT